MEPTVIETTKYLGYELDVIQEEEDFFWMVGEDADGREAGTYDEPGSAHRIAFGSADEAREKGQAFIRQLQWKADR